MARAATIIDTDTPLIEEHVETGLQAMLDHYQPAYQPGGDKKDELAKRFMLYPNKPIPELDTPYAKAFEARDDFNEARKVFALVCDDELPYFRHHLLKDLTGVTIPHLTSLLGAGAVLCSHLDAMRHTMFFERPAGVSGTLMEVVRSQTRLHEHKIIDYVLQPIGEALLALRELKISHGNIHPGAVLVGENTVLRECISSPCGTLGHHIYQPLERKMASPLAQGEATEKTDMYALGILTLELMYGLEKMKAVPIPDFIPHMINESSYNIFLHNREPSEAFQDFFRGTLNDSPAERWGLDQFAQWLGGKHFNMIAPSAPKEAARPFVFAATEYFSRRLLANALHRNWRGAVTDIKSLKLDRWCENSLHRPELAEQIDRVQRVGTDPSATEKQVSDMMTRIITILDPVGPIRTLSLSIRPESIGLVYADALLNNKVEMPQILNLIEQDVATFWSEQLEANKTPEVSQAVWKLQKAKTHLKKKAMGFGVERVLYDLNPGLPCQSPLLKPYNVTTIMEALQTLDAIAKKQAPNASFMDTHLTAFIASKIEMSKEIQLGDLSILPALANNRELIALRMLAKAQQKYPKMQLPGLAAWSAMRVEKMFEEIHNRIIRKRMKLQLKKLASTGKVIEVLSVIINREIIVRDTDGFSKAIAVHQFNQDRIERFQNQDILEYKARKMGGRMAAMICQFALAVMCYQTLTKLFGI